MFKLNRAIHYAKRGGGLNRNALNVYHGSVRGRKIEWRKGSKRHYYIDKNGIGQRYTGIKMYNYK